MSHAAGRSLHQSYGFGARVMLGITPLLAICYPIALQGFAKSVGMIGAPDAGASWLWWFGAASSLLFAFAIPAAALAMAITLSKIARPTQAERRARQAALLSVAVAPIFTFAGVGLYMLGDPVSDVWTVGAFWAALFAWVAFANNEAATTPTILPIPALLRIAHGASALTIVCLFLAFHLTNHLMGLAGPDTHTAFMKAVRTIYRSAIGEPLLVALMLFQIGSGIYLALRHTTGPTDRFRTFQIVSGVYLAFFVLAHMNSVFVFARTFLKIETGWGFATGAPAGLVNDPWNIRLVPHYAFGVFFALAHLSSGARVVMLNHGMRREIANRLMIAGASASSIAAALIVLGMCGLRLKFV